MHSRNAGAAREPRAPIHRARLRWALAAALLVPSTTALSNPTFEVRYGFFSNVRVERLMPVRVELRGDQTDRVLDVRITGTPRARASVELPRNTRKLIWLYTQPYTNETLEKVPQLDVYDGSEKIHSELLQNPNPIGSGARLIPIVGEQALPMPGVAAPRIRVADLPIHIRGYDAVDAVFICPAAWREISGPALRALTLWVRAGGCLILPETWRGERLTLGPEHPFGPVAVGRAETRPRLLPWLGAELLDGRAVDPASAGEGWEDLDVVPPAERSWRLWPPPGKGGEAEDEFPPLLTRRPEGRGQLIFLCFDPQEIPKSSVWPQRDEFFRTLLSPPRFGSITSKPGAWRQTAAAGRAYVISTGRTAVGWFVLFLVLYVFTIGFLDRWLVVRLKRPRLTWITFPAAVIVFSAFAWGLGRGRVAASAYHEVTWVDAVGTGPHGALGRSVVSVFSDTNGLYTLVPDVPAAETWAEEGSGADEWTADSRSGSGGIEHRMVALAEHVYYLTWPAEEALTAARGVLTPDGAAIRKVRVHGSLPAGVEPLFWVVGWNGETRVVPRAGVSVPESGGWELDLNMSLDRSGAAALWQTADSGRVADLVEANAGEFYADSRARGSQPAFVAAVAPTALPVLHIVERDPTPEGLTVVRVPLAVVRDYREHQGE